MITHTRTRVHESDHACQDKAENTHRKLRVLHLTARGLYLHLLARGQPAAAAAAARSSPQRHAGATLRFGYTLLCHALMGRGSV